MQSLQNLRRLSYRYALSQILAPSPIYPPGSIWVTMLGHSLTHEHTSHTSPYSVLVRSIPFRGEEMAGAGNLRLAAQRAADTATLIPVS